MHKKTDIQDLDIPIDDIECWERYPKHRWVYDLSRLLDAQSIKWSLYKTEQLQERRVNLKLDTTKCIIYDLGYIYTNSTEGPKILTEIYLAKGDIKLINFVNGIGDVDGNIELRINAFVSMYFKKFTGIIAMEFIGNDILAIKLRAYSELGQITNVELVKLIKRIYKKSK